MRYIRRSQVSGLLVARGRLLPRRIPLLVFYASLLLVVTACSFGDKTGPQQIGAPPTAAQTKLEPIAPTPSAMDTFRALAPPEGLSFTPLFNEPVKDADARMKRMEGAVQTLRNDFDTVMPTIVRMAAMEKDIKGLVAQLQTLTDGQAQSLPVPPVTPQALPPAANGGKPIPGEDVAKGTEPAKAIAKAGPDAASSLVTPEAAPKGELPPEGAASPSSNAPLNIKPEAKPVSVPAKPAAKPAPEKKAEAAPIVQPPAGTAAAMDIRIADHPDKTRVVLDMTSKDAGAVSLENNGKTLVIDLSQMKWLGKQSWDADSAQLISGYHMDGGKLYVDLMYASQIKSHSVLSPNGDTKNYRLVIDLFSPEVHKK